VKQALELLQEVQAAGDIFFPKHWIEAALSGCTSPSTAAAVREFLARRENYPVRLRQIILQAADDLFRAVDNRDRAISDSGQ
jgi:aminopeptidase N